jgi:hypothetical protein
MEEVATIWRAVAGDLDAKIALPVFTSLNRALDAAIDEKVCDGLCSHLALGSGWYWGLTGIKVRVWL